MTVTGIFPLRCYSTRRLDMKQAIPTKITLQESKLMGGKEVGSLQGFPLTLCWGGVNYFLELSILNFAVFGTS